MLTTALLAATGTVLGVLEWRRLARKHPDLSLKSVLKRAPHVIALVPLVVALLALQVAILVHQELLWDAPVVLELHHAAICFGTVAAAFGFLFGLAAYGAFHTKDRQWPAAVVAGLLAVGIVLGVEWDLSHRVANELGDRVVDGVVLQTSGVSCAAASAANLVRRHGLSQGEREMARLIGTTREGSSPAQVITGLAKLGFSCRKTLQAERDVRRLQTPAMLWLEGRAPHAVLLASVQGERAEVLDPLVGRVAYGWTQVPSTWRGRALECVRGAR